MECIVDHFVRVHEVLCTLPGSRVPRKSPGFEHSLCYITGVIAEQVISEVGQGARDDPRVVAKQESAYTAEEGEEDDRSRRVFLSPAECGECSTEHCVLVAVRMI